MSIVLTFFFYILQFVLFARNYSTTPTVLISANHSTKESGNSAPAHNGITTWIEVKPALELFIVQGISLDNISIDQPKPVKKLENILTFFFTTDCIVSEYCVLFLFQFGIETYFYITNL